MRYAKRPGKPGRFSLRFIHPQDAVGRRRTASSRNRERYGYHRTLHHLKQAARGRSVQSQLRPNSRLNASACSGGSWLSKAQPVKLPWVVLRSSSR